MLDENFLRCRRAALHAINHDDVGTGLHSQRRVVIGPRATNFHIDGFFPIGDFAKLVDLDFEIIWSGPVRVPAGRALVDTLGQAAHLRHPVRNFLPQNIPPPPGFAPCPTTTSMASALRRSSGFMP